MPYELSKKHKARFFSPVLLWGFCILMCSSGIQSGRRAFVFLIRRAFALLFSLLLFSSSLFAQKHLFDAQLITVEEGLANLYTTAVFKDSRGFIWIGTRYGLNRYDGYSFKLYSKENGALNSSEDILKISEDPEGNLWLFLQESRRSPSFWRYS